MEQIQPAQLDYSDRYAIIQYMRELISLGPILLNGFEYEWGRLWSLLTKHGWSNEHLKAVFRDKPENVEDLREAFRANIKLFMDNYFPRNCRILALCSANVREKTCDPSLRAT